MESQLFQVWGWLYDSKLIKETGDWKVQSNYQFSTQYEVESTEKSSINQFR